MSAPVTVGVNRDWQRVMAAAAERPGLKLQQAVDERILTIAEARNIINARLALQAIRGSGMIQPAEDLVPGTSSYLSAADIGSVMRTDKFHYLSMKAHLPTVIKMKAAALLKEIERREAAASHWMPRGLHV